VSTAKEANVRAGHLSLINMIPAYFGFHLSFICDMLGVSLATWRLFNTSTGTMSVLLGLLHVLIHAAGKPNVKAGESWQMYGLIVSDAASIKTVLLISSLRQLCVSPRLFRLPLHEVFLLCHQALIVVVAYALWRHVPSRSFPTMYLLTSGCVFAATFILEDLTILYRNVAVGRGCSRALIARYNDAVRMTIFPARPWKIKAGQYVNVWIPSVDLFPAKPSVHHRILDRRTSGLPRGLDTATELLYAKMVTFRSTRI